jgi:hypothetical protein
MLLLCRHRQAVSQLRNRPGVGGDPRMDEHPHPLYEIIELLPGESPHNRRYVTQGSVNILFGEIDFDVELDFALAGRRVDKHFMVGHRSAEELRQSRSELLRSQN